MHLVMKKNAIAVEIHESHTKLSIVMAGRSAVHERTGEVLAQELEMASSTLARTAGLMFRRTLEPGRGMWIVPCNGIHMMFMRFPIDAVFIDKRGTVLRVYEGVRPWVGIVPFVWRADKVAELPVGAIRRHVIKPGDQLHVAA